MYWDGKEKEVGVEVFVENFVMGIWVYFNVEVWMGYGG